MRQTIIESSSRKVDLTIDELKTRKGFEQYGDEQLESLVITLKSFSQIVYGIWSRKRMKRKKSPTSPPDPPESIKVIFEPPPKNQAA